MSQETMPITDEVKKKHKLFPFNIMRKRKNSKSAKDAKGRSKSLLDLYDGGDKGTVESNHNSLRRKRMSEHQHAPIHVNSSFESNEFDAERDLFERTSEERGAAQSHSGEDSQLEFGDEVDFHDDSEPEEKVVDFNTADLKPQEKDSLEEEGQKEEGDATVEFPLGTTAALAWKTNLCSLFEMEVEIKQGVNLIARDRSGTSDPYVKAKFRGKCVYKSKIVRKNLNPVWNEKFSIFFDDVDTNMVFKVYDFDRLSSDDQMGVASVNVGDLEINRHQELKLDLINLTGLQEDLGQLIVNVLITPKGAADATAELLTRRVSGRNQVKRASRSQVWEGVVAITLVEGKRLNAFDDNGFSDPYCKFKLGNEKHRTKVCKTTLNPQWKEKFELRMYHDASQTLEIQVYDKDPGRDEFMGRCNIDLTPYDREKTHFMEVELEDCAGFLSFYLTITALSLPGNGSDIESYVEKPDYRQEMENQFSLQKTGQNTDEVGWLQIRFHRAVGLAVADLGGSSDPFAIIELNNQKVITPTIYKTLNPTWEKVYEMPVFDVHETINITVLDEDRRGAPEFLGRVGIPLLSIVPLEKRIYQLKDKHLERQAKGHLIVTFDLIFNPIRASLRTFNPREVNALYDPPRFRRQLLQQNVDRLSSIIKSIIATGQFIQSLFTWKYKLRSAFAFILYVLLVLNFDLFFLPLILLLILLKNYIVFMLSPDKDTSSELDSSSPYEDDEDDDDIDDKNKKGKSKSIRERLESITNICTTVQNQLDWIASLAERIKNTFNWSVPFCSYLLMVILAIGTVLLYLIPLRYMLLAWGINKFTKKIRKPNAVGNNELLDFLSRIPSDPDLKQRRRLKTDTALR